MPRQPLAKAAELEIAFRRHLSSKEARAITARPRLRDLVVAIEGTNTFPGKPSKSDLEKNESVLRSIVEVYPDKIPGIQVLCEAVTRLDVYFSGDVIQYDGPKHGFQGDGYMEAVMQQACLLKLLVQRLRRLFRRSTMSRYQF